MGSKNVSYTYDVTGIRSSKTVGATVHRYVTQSGRVVRETYGARVLDFIYDADGRPFAVKYSADSGATFTTYYYVLNVQGDVMGLLNSNGALIVKYTYDAWGRVLSVTNANGTPITSSANIANINPLRYRSYYDTETGFYYLQSRYYDPAVRRFINADSYSSTGQGFLGYNMFAYCGNNPTNGFDPTGLYFNNSFNDWNYVCTDGKTNNYKEKNMLSVLKYKPGPNKTVHIKNDTAERNGRTYAYRTELQGPQMSVPIASFIVKNKGLRLYTPEYNVTYVDSYGVYYKGQRCQYNRSVQEPFLSCIIIYTFSHAPQEEHELAKGNL